ncbi:MAG: hypothetical protein HOV80_16650 [Polyangiaceae bacterium]|nr:hypothetical protein [Polyangiaceae bacterium]
MRRSTFLAAVLGASLLGACAGADEGAKPGSTASTGKAPSSDALVEMVRTSKLPESGCSGPTPKPSLGVAYVDQAAALEVMSKNLEVPFVQTGECKPSTEEDVSRVAQTVSQAVWYCTVSASPDWEKVKRGPGEEEGGASFEVGFGLDADGVIVPDSVKCVAPG